MGPPFLNVPVYRIDIYSAVRLSSPPPQQPLTLQKYTFTKRVYIYRYMYVYVNIHNVHIYYAYTCTCTSAHTYAND